MPTNRRAFAPTKTEDDNGVDGKVSNAYSIPTMSANLTRIINVDINLEQYENLLHKKRIFRPPGNERKLQSVPGVELVVKGASK